MGNDPQFAWRQHSGSTAWPTLVMSVLIYIAWLTVLTAHAAGQLGHAAALIMNTALVYVAFTPLHEAVHGNVGGSKSRAWLDPFVGWPMGMMLLAPYPAVRSIHLRHHARTNDAEADPDFFVRGPWYVALAKSFLILPHYHHTFFTKLVHTSSAAKAQRTLMLAGIGVVLTTLVALAIGGFGTTALFAIVLPALIGTGLLAFLFDWLPHHPHDTEGRFVDTRVVEDGWLTLPLLWQNFHLVHHLWPRVPFYRYGALYREVHPLLLAKGARIERWVGEASPIEQVEPST